MKLIAVLVLLLLPMAVPAAVKPNPLFSDGAVLQCELPVPVWGTATAGEKVTVTFAGQTVTTTADGKGEWQVKLQPVKPTAAPQTMTIAGENTVTLTNLLVGEVWVCSGQSNMYWPLSNTANATEAIASANDPQLRLFTVKPAGNDRQQREVNGAWAECSSKTVAGFSAVAYYFGRDLRAAVKRPIGLIHSSVGGSEAEQWTSRATLQSAPELRGILADYETALTNYQIAWTAYRTNQPALLAQHRAAVEAAQAAGQPTPRPPAAPINPANSGPTSLYNAMIAPLQPFAIRGVIWYQGESNHARHAQYRALFPALIRGWREAWGPPPPADSRAPGGDFPFLFVQIAPYIGMPPEIRDAQLFTWQTTPNTAMVVITDHGEARNVHPKMKEPVGARLALAARALAYGEKIEYSGPVIDTLTVAENRAVLTFTHRGGGLVAQAGELKGFTIAGVDETFVPAEAQIQGETVVVTSQKVPQPVAVAYGCPTTRSV